MKLSRVLNFAPWIASIVLAFTFCSAQAEERTMTAEQMLELSKTGDFGEGDNKSIGKLPDMTKGDPLPPTENKPWTLGPSGVVCMWVGDMKKGDQIFVKGALNGSPAAGKIFPGDVIIGVNGKKFTPGCHLGITVGNAIVESERAANGGKLIYHIWRDKNYVARNGKADVRGVDIDKFFDEARDDNSLYDWKPEEARQQEVRQMGFDKFPLDPVTLDVELKLRVFPEYSDTSPYDCPKVDKILEEAWTVLEKKFVVDPKNKRSGRGGSLEALALIASGKPEHREIVHKWVRSKNSPWNPPTQKIGAMFEPGYKGYKGMQSWHHGYNGLNCALYYDATGDEYVLPALRKYAIETAMGQSGGGSWGHTFAYPSFNGGEFHKMNPGYGALNAAGNRCFFLIALAQKLGVEHPEIEMANKRAHHFFGSYVDQGAIPYGDHGAAGTDDSNGKNTGIAFAMKVLGDKYGSKYFAQMSTHCSFTRRGGHAADYHGNWSSWAATLTGPEGRILAERNLRWRRTLCRMYDGSFVYHSPTGKYGTLRDPTATEVIHQAVPLKQTLITGKDLDESMFTTEKEMEQMLQSAYPQFNDDKLKEMVGTRWNEGATDEVFKMLNIFKPKARGICAKELAKRYKAGETEIVTRLLSLLEHEDPRMRDGALRALAACGDDVVLPNLSKIIKLLDDPKAFVRITASKTVSGGSDKKDVQLAILNSTLKNKDVAAPNSLGNAVQNILFTKDTPLAKQPFRAGLDDQLVVDALEKLILLDPAGKSFMTSREKVWDKNTIVRLAGPLTYAAEEEQVGDQMFANRAAPARALLAKFNYQEAYEGAIHNLRKRNHAPRMVRPLVSFKDPLVDPILFDSKPAAFKQFTKQMQDGMIDNPLTSFGFYNKRTKKKEVIMLINMLELAEKEKESAKSSSIYPDARAMFYQELDQLDGAGAKIKACRDELNDPQKKNTFRKMAAMELLADLLGADSLEDLVPYLGHPYWRLHEHSQTIAANLVKAGGDAQLVSIYTSGLEPDAHCGVLELIAAADHKEGLSFVSSSLGNTSPDVRRAAINSLYEFKGKSVMPDFIKAISKAETRIELLGYEETLLSEIDDKPYAKSLSKATIAALKSTKEAHQRDSLYYILARLGDSESLAALKGAAITDDFQTVKAAAFAMSFSPSREADKILLEIASLDKQSAAFVGSHSVRRMLIGPQGYGDVTVEEKMDFAEAMLRKSLDKGLIAFLGEVHEARSLRALMYCLENGVSTAADSLVACAEGMGKLSDKDAKIAEESLRNVIEYIEVTQLRGGVEGKDFREYPKWKALQARAGKVLLKVHKPEKVAIPEFNDIDLDF